MANERVVRTTGTFTVNGPELSDEERTARELFFGSFNAELVELRVEYSFVAVLPFQQVTSENVGSVDNGYQLAAKEQLAFETLLSSLGQIVPSEMLVRTLASSSKNSSNAVAVIMSRLRKRLTGTPYKVQPVRGKGYKLVQE